MHQIRRRFVLLTLLAVIFGAIAVTSSQARPQTFVSGTIYEADGRPAVSIWVVLEKDGREWKFLTGDDGKYFIGHVAPGRYRLLVKRGGKPVASSVINLPADSNRDIHLQ